MAPKEVYTELIYASSTPSTQEPHASRARVHFIGTPLRVLAAWLSMPARDEPNFEFECAEISFARACLLLRRVIVLRNNKPRVIRYSYVEASTVLL